MSLEAKIEELTAAVRVLTATIDGMLSTEVKAPWGGIISPVDFTQTCSVTVKPGLSQNSEAPNDQSSSIDMTPCQPSTDESSFPELDYVKDVKPITLRLSKEKGREATVAVLQRFGVKGAQELDKAQWADYIAHCGKVLAGSEV